MIEAYFRSNYFWHLERFLKPFCIFAINAIWKPTNWKWDIFCMYGEDARVKLWMSMTFASILFRIPRIWSSCHYAFRTHFCLFWVFFVKSGFALVGGWLVYMPPHCLTGWLLRAQTFNSLKYWSLYMCINIYMYINLLYQ